MAPLISILMIINLSVRRILLPIPRIGIGDNIFLMTARGRALLRYYRSINVTEQPLSRHTSLVSMVWELLEVSNHTTLMVVYFQVRKPYPGVLIWSGTTLDSICRKCAYGVSTSGSTIVNNGLTEGSGRRTLINNNTSGLRADLLLA